MNREKFAEKWRQAQGEEKQLSPEEELEDALIDMVGQHCCLRSHGGYLENDAEHDLDSWALSANAGAMRLLAKRGKIKIFSESGRRIIADWV